MKHLPTILILSLVAMILAGCCDCHERARPQYSQEQARAINSANAWGCTMAMAGAFTFVAGGASSLCVDDARRSLVARFLRIGFLLLAVALAGLAIYAFTRCGQYEDLFRSLR